MDVYNAILAAADQVEKNPSSFDFYESNIPILTESPPYCGSIGCALGWIGYFMGYKRWQQLKEVARALTNEPGCPETNVYCNLDAIDNTWRRDGLTCARTLRIYAKRFAPPQPAIPDSVREIFNGAAPCPTPSPILSTADALTTGSETLLPVS